MQNNSHDNKYMPQMMANIASETLFNNNYHQLTMVFIKNSPAN